MKATTKEIRRLVREEREYLEALHELFGSKPKFGKMMDAILGELQVASKHLEQAHQVAPEGTAKAIVAGLHSDLFNKVSEFRKYVGQLKNIEKQAQPTPGKKDAPELNREARRGG